MFPNNIVVYKKQVVYCAPHTGNICIRNENMNTLLNVCEIDENNKIYIFSSTIF